MFGHRYFGERFYGQRYFGGIGSSVAASTVQATVLVNGIPNIITATQVSTGLKPIVYVSNRFRQRVAAEGTPLVFDTTTKRWRLLQAGETLSI